MMFSTKQDTTRKRQMDKKIRQMKFDTRNNKEFQTTFFSRMEKWESGKVGSSELLPPE